MSRGSPAILSLPDDAILAFFQYLDVEDVLKARQTCKRFYHLSCTKQLWLQFLHCDVTSKGLPTLASRVPPESLSPKGCEQAVTDACRLFKRLRCADEDRVCSYITLHQPRSVTWVQIVGERFLVVASSDQSSSAIALWSLSSLLDAPVKHRPAPVAEAFLDGPVATGLAEIQEGVPVFALELRCEFTTIVEILSVSAKPCGVAFTRLKNYVDDISHINMLHGDLIGFGLHQGLCLPSILDWKTGVVANLTDGPNVMGGPVSMSVHKDVVVVVTACEVRSFRIRYDQAGIIAAQLCGVFRLDHTVGSAQSLFYRQRPSDLSPTLFVCICGFDGVFVSTISMAQLLAPRSNTDITTVWSLAADREEIENGGSDDELYQPHFGKYFPTLSWLFNSYSKNRPIRFATLPVHLRNSPSDNAAAVLPESRLDQVDLPALYALGVYDYHEVLGLAVFGNAFGELALFNIGEIDLNKSSEYLTPLRLHPLTDNCELVSETKLPITSSPPFPLAGPVELPERYKEAMRAIWITQQPADIPEGWERDGIPVRRLYFMEDDWIRFVPRMPRYGYEFAWRLEHEYHFYGAIVPLVRNNWVSIFSAGGLFFTYFHWEEPSLRVVPPGVSLDELLDVFREDVFGPTVALEDEWSVRHVTLRYWRLWDWERLKLGRNRWLELKDRGGDVHAERTDDLPEPTPEYDDSDSYT